MKNDKQLKPLTPPDLQQCQAEKPNGNSFMTLGGRPGLERCTSKPTVIAEEALAGADGRHGSMSLCEECRKALIRQLGANYCSFTPIDVSAVASPS
jgi:hypothetical protein